MMNGMIVCAEPLAAEAGREVLLEGNAADAAVATAFAQGVVNPFMCGLGGMGIAAVHHGPTAERTVLDCYAAIGSVPPPASWADEYIGRLESYGRFVIKSEDNQAGYKSIMVPGVVRGYAELWRRYGSGRVAWRRLVEPALRLAREGFAVGATLAGMWGRDDDAPGLPSRAAKFARSPEAARVYGRPHREGERFGQPDYARTLERIGDGGPEEFYAGALGREIAADLERRASLIAPHDLSGYRAGPIPPLVGMYRDCEIAGPPVPCGTAHVLEMLQVADGLDLARLDPLGPDYVELVTAIMRVTFGEHVPLKLDPPYLVAHHRLHELTSRLHAGEVRERIKAERRGADPGTTHLTAADDEGTVVSFTHSLGSGAGSGVVTPGLGFLYNNFLGHYNPLPNRWDSIVPGKRGVGTTPAVLYRTGRPWLGIGAAGGSRINTAVFQTILNIVERGMTARDAVAAPRCHSEEADIVFVEGDAYPEATVRDLGRRGYDVRRTQQVARVQAVLIDPTGTMHPGPDPRGGSGFAQVP